MPLYIIGFMGSGKTTAGKKLANKLGYLFIDMDAYLEKKYLQSIPELFEDKGEDIFRKLERQCLDELSNLDEVVVSTGGGAPCFFDNMALMKETGKTIYLSAPPAVLVNRLENAKTERPVLKAADHNDDLKQFIQEKLSERETYYQQADIEVDATNLKVKDILDLL